jgi:uncharacterized protein
VLTEKVSKLKELLKGYEKCVIAFSGGVDSSLLLFYAVKVLGKKNVYPVMFKAPFYSDKEQERGRGLIKKLQLKPILIDTYDISNLKAFGDYSDGEAAKQLPEQGKKQAKLEEDKSVLELIEVDVSSNLREKAILNNLPDRCYVCKTRGMEHLKKIADEKGCQNILFGDNADDSPEFRPGMKAVLEAGGKMPLREAGLTKKEIKVLAQLNFIMAWAYAPNSCYLTRFPEGKKIDLEKVKNIKKIEGFIRQFFPYIRVRVRELPDEKSVSIEIASARQGDFLKFKKKIIQEIEAYGYKNIYLYLNPKVFPLPQNG